jgi:hypothetical protein
MRALGILLLLAGAGIYLLPQYGISFRFIDMLGDQRPMFAGGLALIGLSLLLFSGRGRR